MPSGCLKGSTITVVYPINTFKPEWTKSQIEKWIIHAGGKHNIKLTDNTTHIVCTQNQWRQPNHIVRAALELKKKKFERVHIVSPDWLEETLNASRKAKESHFSWEKLDPTAHQRRKKAEKEVEQAEKEKSGPKTTSGLLQEVFEQSTDDVLTEEEKRKLEAEVAKVKKAKADAAIEAEKQREKEKREKKEQEAIFRKGAKKAKNEIFSDNHHIHMDHTGFKYEITLTKVDTKHNRNERFVLTLYESNIEPATYAMNVHSAGTGRVPSNNVITAIGCNFQTAMHAFKKVFKEKTRVAWDDRISFAVERAKREKRNRGQGTGSPEGTVLGQIVTEGELEEGLKAMEEEDFNKRPFMYHPPPYGARGVLPEKAKDVFPEIGPPVALENQKRVVEDVEIWMSGANGSGPSPTQQGPAQTPAAAAQVADGLDGEEDAEFEAFMNNAAAETGGLGDLTNRGQSGDVFDFDVGNTDYPFDIGKDFDVGEDFDFNMPNSGDSVVAEAAEEPVVEIAEQPASEQNQDTMPETFGHTQMAEDAAAGLAQFMGDGQTVTATETTPPQQQEVEVEEKPTTVKTSTGASLNPGSSILGKRKTSPTFTPLPASKKPSPTSSDAFVDAPEGFGDDSYQVGHEEMAAEGTTPRAHAVDNNVNDLNQEVEVDVRDEAIEI